MSNQIIIYPINLDGVNIEEFMKAPFVTVNNKQSAEAVVAKATALSTNRAEIEFIDNTYLGNGWELHPIIEERTTGKVLIILTFIHPIL